MKTALIVVVIGLVSTIWGIVLIFTNPLEDLTLFTCSREIKAQEFCTRTKIASSKVESKTISVQDIKAAKVEAKKVEEEIVKQVSPYIPEANNNENSSIPSEVKATNKSTPSSEKLQYRLVLILTTSDEFFPLTDYVSENKYDAKKNKINNFLLTVNEPYLDIKLDHSYTINLYLGLALSSIGLVVVLIILLVVVVFLWRDNDRHEKEISDQGNQNLSLQEEVTQAKEEIIQWQEWCQHLQEQNGAYQTLPAENQCLKAQCEEYERQIEAKCREHEEQIDSKCKDYEGQIRLLKRDHNKLKKEKQALSDENNLCKEFLPKSSFTIINSQKNPELSGNFNRGDFMSEGVNVGGNFNLNATNSVVNLRDISGSVTSTIAQLQQSTSSETAQLAEWLKELQGAIETEPALKPEDKAEALEQVETLAKTGENPQDGALKKLSNTAVKILKGTIATLPDTAKLADACSKLLPLITKVLGI